MPGNPDRRVLCRIGDGHRVRQQSASARTCRCGERPGGDRPETAGAAGPSACHAAAGREFVDHGRSCDLRRACHAPVRKHLSGSRGHGCSHDHRGGGLRQTGAQGLVGAESRSSRAGGGRPHDGRHGAALSRGTSAGSSCGHLCRPGTPGHDLHRGGHRRRHQGHDQPRRRGRDAERRGKGTAPQGLRVRRHPGIGGHASPDRDRERADRCGARGRVQPRLGVRLFPLSRDRGHGGHRGRHPLHQGHPGRHGRRRCEARATPSRTSSGPPTSSRRTSG